MDKVATLHSRAIVVESEVGDPGSLHDGSGLMATVNCGPQGIFLAMIKMSNKETRRVAGWARGRRGASYDRALAL